MYARICTHICTYMYKRRTRSLQDFHHFGIEALAAILHQRCTRSHQNLNGVALSSKTSTLDIEPFTARLVALEVGKTSNAPQRGSRGTSSWAIHSTSSRPGKTSDTQNRGTRNTLPQAMHRMSAGPQRRCNRSRQYPNAQQRGTCGTSP